MQRRIRNTLIHLFLSSLPVTVTFLFIYRHGGDNRSGKSWLMAFYGWEAYNEGRTVYCNCPPQLPGEKKEHVLNFPHVDAQPASLFERDLFRACVIIDQAELFMDAFDAPKGGARDISNFGYQATKREVDFHFDTVRQMNILNRVRENAHFFITTKRIPPNPGLPLIAILVIVRSRYRLDRPVRFVIREPWNLYWIYNHEVIIKPPKLVEKILNRQIPIPANALVQQHMVPQPLAPAPEIKPQWSW